VILASDDYRRCFVPQIDISHQLDIGDDNASIIKKRENAVLRNGAG